MEDRAGTLGSSMVIDLEIFRHKKLLEVGAS
jgi:hypothetical protein